MAVPSYHHIKKIVLLVALLKRLFKAIIFIILFYCYVKQRKFDLVCMRNMNNDGCNNDIIYLGMLVLCYVGTDGYLPACRLKHKLNDLSFYGLFLSQVYLALT